jgi:hypothetical protein
MYPEFKEIMRPKMWLSIIGLKQATRGVLKIAISVLIHCNASAYS